MRILPFNNVPSSLMQMGEKIVGELSPQAKKIGVIVLAIFTTCMIAIGAYRLIYFKGRRLGQAAEKLRKEWKLEAAAKKFEEALKHDPKDMTNVMHYAKTLIALRKQDEATLQYTKIVEHYKKMVETNPNDHKALREYAKALFIEWIIKTGDQEQYLENLQKLPDDQALEKLEEQIKLFKEISSKLDKVIEKDPRDIVALRFITKVLAVQAMYSTILSGTKLAIQDPGKPMEDIMGAVKKEEMKEILKHAMKVLLIAPKDPRVLKDNAKVLAVNQQNDEAHKQLEEILKIDPKNVHALHLLGLSFSEKKDYQAAEKHFAQCLAVRPGYLKAIKDRGINFENLKKLEDAQKQYEKALDIYPNDVEGLLLYGNVLRELKKPKDAIKQYEKALKIEPENKSLLEAKEKAGWEIEESYPQEDVYTEG